MKRVVTSIIIVLMAMNMVFLSLAKVEEKSTVTLSKKIITESQLSVAYDNSGGRIIILTNEEQLPMHSRSVEKRYKTTVVAILPENEQAADEIIANIRSVRDGSGHYTEDNWYFSSSVYLESTVYWTTIPYNEFFNLALLTNVDIACRTNSGSTVDSMDLQMYSSGTGLDGRFHEQEKTFNAKYETSFVAPSSWVPVDKSGGLFALGARLTATATRPNGSSATFTLTNNPL